MCKITFDKKGKMSIEPCGTDQVVRVPGASIGMLKAVILPRRDPGKPWTWATIVKEVIQDACRRACEQPNG